MCILQYYCKYRFFVPSLVSLSEEGTFFLVHPVGFLSCVVICQSNSTRLETKFFLLVTKTTLLIFLGQEGMQSCNFFFFLDFQNYGNYNFGGKSVNYNI